MSIEDAEALYADGKALYEAGSYEEAADRFAELLWHPDFPTDGTREVHWNLGMCFVRLNNREKAIAQFEAGGWPESEYKAALQEQSEKMDEARTDSAKALLQEANDLFNAGSYEAAAGKYAELLIDPGLPATGMNECHWNLGLCYFQLGDDERGRGHMAAGHYADSDYREAYERIVAARG